MCSMSSLLSDVARTRVASSVPVNFGLGSCLSHIEYALTGAFFLIVSRLAVFRSRFLRAPIGRRTLSRECARNKKLVLRWPGPDVARCLTICQPTVVESQLTRPSKISWQAQILLDFSQTKKVADLRTRSSIKWVQHKKDPMEHNVVGKSTPDHA